MVNSKAFFDKTIELINYVAEAERENIYTAAQMMGDCMNENGVVQLFGLDYGKEFAMELGYRAGGLMPFHKVEVNDLILRGVMDATEVRSKEFVNNPESAHKLLDLYRIEKEDMYIMIGDSGCEAILVEAALRAKNEGKKVIAVVGMKAALAGVSTHPTGKKLHEVADLVVDTHAEVVDVVVDVDGVHKMNHVGTLVANVIAQMMTAETYRYLVEKDCECPVLLSQNLKGADEHNRNLSSKYDGRWNS